MDDKGKDLDEDQFVEEPEELVCEMFSNLFSSHKISAY